MILSVYAMRDALSGFLTPTFEVNDQVAERNFVHAVSNAGLDSILSSHFDQFSLYRLGTLDTDSGALTSELPVFLLSGSDAFRPRKEADSDA